ncbi:MAG: hypothetical protein OXE95_04735 [Chloroflexi bacterium]|nr:hypothetical protein [Chloroflexota bacterium]MCY4246868.1 hypothetical protein [Chloroflexota bacterium]
MYTIASLHEFRRHLQLAPDDASADADLLRSLQEASHYLESATQRRYCPRLAMLLVEYDRAGRGEVVLPDDLLELRTISDESGEIDTRRIRRLPQDADLSASVLRIRGGIVGALRIYAIWGWHDRWTSAWRGSGEKLTNKLNADEKTLKVASAASSDASGASPRFQVGQLLRIAGEYLRIIEIDSAGKQLTVLRGSHGTAANAHSSGLDIDIYAPPAAIVDLCLRYADLLLRSGGFVDDKTPELLLRLRRARL